MSAHPPVATVACHEFRAHEGRLELRLRVLPQGRDLHASLLGGEWHVGATALSGPNGVTQVSERPAHREGALAAMVARRLATGLSCAVSVSAGIHFADITRAEIAAVERLAESLVEEALAALSSRRTSHAEHGRTGRV